MAEITIKNLDNTDTETLRQEMFKMVETHVDFTTMNKDKFLFLLGYYPAIYAYYSELYTFMIAKVRERVELRDKFGADRARDKKDILEQALKSCKLQYDSLSRKITIFSEESHAPH